MLIEFSVSNYRSFRERQTFSMVAAPRLKKKSCVFMPEVLGEKFPGLLKVAAIYGPNASGKSNLLMAMDTVQKISRLKPNSDGDQIPVSPFRFDEDLANEASRFEFHFIQNKQRYQFELAATKSRIMEEKLIAYPRGVETLLYERVVSDAGEVYSFGEKLEGGEDLHKLWEKLTGPQILFISQAVANSNEELQQLRVPLKWLQGEFTVLEDSDMDRWTRVVKAMTVETPAVASEVSRYLRDVDVPVTNIVFENESFDEKNSAKEKSLRKKSFEELLADTNERRMTLIHKTDLGSAAFDLSEESKGTRNLLGFFLPWSVLSRHIVIVDELDSSLHPKIVSSLVKKHLTGTDTGQLIFTTHDTHLMDTDLLRRDQFWLTERNGDGATRLRSIHDFRGREGEDIEKRYYEGHYRALPVLESAD